MPGLVPGAPIWLGLGLVLKERTKLRFSNSRQKCIKGKNFTSLFSKDALSKTDSRDFYIVTEHCYCSFELSIYQRIQKKAAVFKRLISRNGS